MKKNTKLSPKDDGLYLAVNKLSALLRAITSKHYGDFYCLNFFLLFETEKKFE